MAQLHTPAEAAEILRIRESWLRAKAGVMDRLWRRGDRPGPQVFRDVSTSARRRWKFDAADLPEKKAYRPAPLQQFAAELDACPALPHPQPGTFRIVRVQPRETLRSIAQRELGSDARWEDIFNLNLDVLEDPDHVYVGMPLRVPSAVPSP